MRLSSRLSPFARGLAGIALACSAANEDTPRVVSLTPQGTRAVTALGLSRFLVAEDAASHPDLVLVPAMSEDGEGPQAMRASGAPVLAVDPHDFSDAFALFREIARALGDEAAGRATIQRIGDPLAQMSASNLGKRRPLVAALVSLDPPILAGGHSFVADLIEAAGAETITHGDEVAQVPVRNLDEIRARAPELVLIATPAPPPEQAREFVRGWFAPIPVALVAVDTAELWLAGSLDAATAIQDRVDDVRSNRVP
jgi:ABC-type Fe3+-hydroxamate transport system substrate-binding protein